MRDEETGKIIPKDEEQFYLERLREKRKAQEPVGASTLGIPKMNAPSRIANVFRGEHVPNAMTRRDYTPNDTSLGIQRDARIRRMSRTDDVEPMVEQRDTEPEIEPKREPIEVHRNVTVTLPANVQMELDRIDDSVGQISKDMMVMAKFIDNLTYTIKHGKNQDIDAMFRKRCAMRRTQGFCKYTAKGRNAKGGQAHTQKSETDAPMGIQSEE